MARYEFWLTSDTGTRLALLNPLWISATRVANAIGRLNLGVAPDFDPAWLRRDRIVQVWRGPPDGALALWRPYFVRGWRYEMQGNVERLTINGADGNDLLRRRVVAYATDTSQGKKAAKEADDLAKEIVDENMVSASTSARNWSSLSVQADLTLGPQLNRTVSWRNVAKALADIAKAAKAAGTEVFYDVAARASQSSISFVFVTKTGQPGQDLTGRGALFSKARRNLEEPYYDVDYGDEVNYVYGLGQGEGSDRNTQEVSDSDRINASAWNRCEGVADARSEKTDNGVREEARRALTEGEPVIRAGGRILDTEGVRFGRDWNWGDKVRFAYRGEFDAIIRTVTLSLGGDGRETIQGRLDYEG